MNSSFLHGKQVYLRAVEPEDLDVMYEMENDPEMWEISGFTEPYSRHSLREYITSNQNDIFADKQLRLMIVCKETSEVAGMVDLDHFDARHLRAGVGIAIRTHLRRRGIALEALQLLQDYVFCFLHLHQLYAYIPLFNTGSMKLFTAAGFVQVAILTDWLRTKEGYKDVALLQRIAE